MPRGRGHLAAGGWPLLLCQTLDCFISSRNKHYGKAKFRLNRDQFRTLFISFFVFNIKKKICSGENTSQDLPSCLLRCN